MPSRNVPGLSISVAVIDVMPAAIYGELPFPTQSRVLEAF
jgi:hypothetical protein